MSMSNMMRQLRPIAKAVAGAAAGAVTGVGTTLVIVPPEVDMPWWGHLIAAIAGAIINAGIVYLAPANKPARVP